MSPNTSQGTSMPEFDAELQKDLRLGYAGMTISSLTYGAYFVLTGMAVHLMRKNGKRYGARRLTSTYICLMFLATTIWYMDGVWGSELQFAEIRPAASPTSLTICAKISAITQFLLSDALLLYRMHMAWNRDHKITILPAVGYLGSIICAYCAQLYAVGPMLVETARKLRLGFLIGTTVVNLVTTTAIMYRLWTMMQQTALYRRENHVEARVVSILLILGQSGALYTSMGLAFAVTAYFDSPWEAVFGILFQPMTFLNSTFIILNILWSLPGSKQPMIPLRNATDTAKTNVNLTSSLATTVIRLPKNVHDHENSAENPPAGWPLTETERTLGDDLSWISD